jgi:hypothetical protein
LGGRQNRVYNFLENNKNVGQADVLKATSAKYVSSPTYLKPRGNASDWPSGPLRMPALMADVLNATWLAHRASTGAMWLVVKNVSPSVPTILSN